MSPLASIPLQLRVASKPRARRRALISLTPLIDVVFILLVFFMLASSFLDWRSITLDAPATASGGGSTEGALLVQVRRDGVRLSGETMTLDTLRARVAQSLARQPERRVLVMPTTGVALQEAVRVLDALSGADVRHLSLIRNLRR